MSDSAIYRKLQLGQTLKPGRHPALVLVDFVNGFLDPEIFGGGNSIDALGATVPVLDAARETGCPVVFTRIVYDENGANTGVWCEKAPRLAELTNANPASQVHPALSPRTGEYVLCKTQASAFFGTDLAAVLTGWRVDTVLVAGCTTSGCVRATVVDAISHNFRPVVIRDCVGDRALPPHEANLFDMEQKYAALWSARQTMDYLRAHVG